MTQQLYLIVESNIMINQEIVLKNIYHDLVSDNDSDVVFVPDDGNC